MRMNDNDSRAGLLMLLLLLLLRQAISAHSLSKLTIHLRDSVCHDQTRYTLPRSVCTYGPTFSNLTQYWRSREFCDRCVQWKRTLAPPGEYH